MKPIMAAAVILMLALFLSVVDLLSGSCPKLQDECNGSKDILVYNHSYTCGSVLKNNTHLMTVSDTILCIFRDTTAKNIDMTWIGVHEETIEDELNTDTGGCPRISLQWRANVSVYGIYTCNVFSQKENFNLSFHVGIYSHHDEPQLSPVIEVLYNVLDAKGSDTIGLKWTTTNRPVGDVDWLRDNKDIDDSMYQTRTVLQDRANATYDHLLMIPRDVLNRRSVYTYKITLPSDVNAPNITFMPVPPTPSNIAYNSANSSLSWAVQTSNSVSFVQFYHIEYEGGWCEPGQYSIEVDIGTVKVEGVTSASVELQLEPGASYTIQVKSSNFIHDSQWSSMYTVQPPAQVPTGAPSILTARAISSSSVFVEWDELDCSQRNGHITGYILRYGSSESDWIDIPVNDGLTHLVTDLIPSVEYSFKVAALNDAGASVYSNVTFCTTPAENGTTTTTAPTTTATTNESGEKSGDSTAIVYTITMSVVLVICLIVTSISAAYCITRRRKVVQAQREVLEWHTYVHDPSPEPQEMDQVVPKEIEPTVEDFPEDCEALRGEYLIFYVTVSSNSPLSLSWFHNDQNVITDSSIEVRSDGTLSIPCVEDSHAGLFRMVARNDYGSSSWEFKLSLSEDDCSTEDLCTYTCNDCEPVVVSSFEEYVASHHAKNNEAFHVQFVSLNNFDEEASVGCSVENKHLNRYRHIYPYDNNRVTLEPIQGYNGTQNTYINASYIKDLKQQQKFIATQAPMPSTVMDFWHLVWQERASTVVMVTNIMEGHRVRCQQYWPTTGSQAYGPFTVYLEEEDKLADYIIRRLTVFLTTASEPPFCVTHYQFTSWPDHHTPDHASPLLSLRSRVMNQYKTAKGHILVHCSSGVGRTGVFIALDIILEQAQKEGVVDVMGVVNKLREQRMRKVQTVAQYIFLYDSVLESLVCGETQVEVCNMRTTIKRLQRIDREEGKNGFEKQYLVLKRITPNQCEARAQLTGTFSSLNRSIDLLACEQRRVLQSGYPGATFIDGYRHKKAFIITQGPSDDMCAEFWKMIVKHKCGCIVMLSDKLEYSQEVCCQYWPGEGAVTYGELSVELVSERTREEVIIRIFSITQTQTQEMSLVTQFQVMNWMPDGQCSNYRTITSLLKDVLEVQRKTGNHPILTHCSDPVGRSAIFCAVMTVIERCKIEGVVNVFQVVKAMRMQKHGAIQSIDQYSCIFDIILAYLDSMDTYANFQ